METLFFPKANKILDRPEIPETEGISIMITDPIRVTPSLEAHQDYFQSEAERLCNALVKHLPQGITWKLMVLLMQKQSNELLGSFNGSMKGSD